MRRARVLAAVSLDARLAWYIDAAAANVFAGLSRGDLVRGGTALASWVA